MNELPGGKRHAMTQIEHEKWNSIHYPGTKQLCSICCEPTGCCEEEGIYTKDGDYLCYKCQEENPDLVDS